MIKDIFFYSLLGGILSFKLSYYYIHYIIYATCVCLDGFIVGFFVTMVCLRYVKHYWSIIIGGLIGGIVGGFTKLLPLWIF